MRVLSSTEAVLAGKVVVVGEQLSGEVKVENSADAPQTPAFSTLRACWSTLPLRECQALNADGTFFIVVRTNASTNGQIFIEHVPSTQTLYRASIELGKNHIMLRIEGPNSSTFSAMDKRVIDLGTVELSNPLLPPAVVPAAVTVLDEELHHNAHAALCILVWVVAVLMLAIALSGPRKSHKRRDSHPHGLHHTNCHLTKRLIHA